jgi:hypothetical protein
MTASELMSDHPTEETLAAFADNQMDPAEHKAVIEHLATCGDCRELVMLAADVKASGELQEQPRAAANVVPFRRRPWLVPAAGVAAAAVIVFLMVQPFGNRDVDKLEKAWASLEKRPMDARIAADVPYRKPKDRLRGPGDEKETTGSNWQAYELASETKDPHVRGVALLMTGERDELAGAITALEEAQSQAKGDERNAIDLDLAAALLSRHSSDDDAERALTLSEDVWKRKRLPVAAWNRAVATQALSYNNDALVDKAWKDYLAVDSTSKWADEARLEIKRLAPTTF